MITIRAPAGRRLSDLARHLVALAGVVRHAERQGGLHTPIPAMTDPDQARTHTAAGTPART